MKEFHAQIKDDQEKAGVRVIKPPHALGFLDRNLPEKSRSIMAERAIKIAKELEAQTTPRPQAVEKA